MERFLKPECLDVDPNTGDVDKQYNHWKRTFDNFLSSLRDPDKLSILINFVSAKIYEYIADAEDFDQAMNILKKVYIKPKNEVFARHILFTSKQNQGESLDQFLNRLKSLSKDCGFTAVTAEKQRDDSIRDAFISGLVSGGIRQRLLEKDKLDPQMAFDTARSLEMAEKQNHSFNPTNNYVAASSEETSSLGDNSITASTYNSNSNKCYFCGNNRHPRIKCPAKDVTMRSPTHCLEYAAHLLSLLELHSLLTSVRTLYVQITSL